jgi:hypothetical protein
MVGISNVWLVVGMTPIAIGMASLVNEIHNDRQVYRRALGAWHRLASSIGEDFDLSNLPCWRTAKRHVDTP